MTPPSLEQRCPVRDVLDRMGDQWSMLVMLSLAPGVLRFGELNARIGDVSKQMLSRTLRRLEEDGLVSRKVFAVVPPRVEYRLTPLGQSFLAPLNHLVAWAGDNHCAIVSARQAYQDRSEAA